MRASVRRIRFQSFDGKNVRFFDVRGGPDESLPLASPYHALAATIPAQALCKATIVANTMIVLEMTPRMEAPVTPNCNVCGRPNVEEGNAHDQPPPAALGGTFCNKKLDDDTVCNEKIRRWCPCNHGKICVAGHRS